MAVQTRWPRPQWPVKFFSNPTRKFWSIVGAALPIVVVSCLCRGEKCAAHFGPSQTEIPSYSAGCGSSRVTSVCVHVDVTAPSRDLDLRQQLPSLDESFAEPKYRTPSPANFLGDQLYLLTRFHGRFSVVSVSVCDGPVSCVLMFSWTWRQTSVLYVFTNTFSVLVYIWLLHVWFFNVVCSVFQFWSIVCTFWNQCVVIFVIFTGNVVWLIIY